MRRLVPVWVDDERATSIRYSLEHIAPEGIEHVDGPFRVPVPSDDQIMRNLAGVFDMAYEVSKDLHGHWDPATVTTGGQMLENIARLREHFHLDEGSDDE